MLKINNVEENDWTVYAKPIVEIPRLSLEITVFHTQGFYSHESACKDSRCARTPCPLWAHILKEAGTRRLHGEWDPFVFKHGWAAGHFLWQLLKEGGWIWEASFWGWKREPPREFYIANISLWWAHLMPSLHGQEAVMWKRRRDSNPRRPNGTDKPRWVLPPLRVNLEGPGIRAF